MSGSKSCAKKLLDHAGLALGKALNGPKDWEKPLKINTDKAPTYAIAIRELKAEGKCPDDTEHR